MNILTKLDKNTLKHVKMTRESNKTNHISVSSTVTSNHRPKKSHPISGFGRRAAIRPASRLPSQLEKITKK